MRALHPPPLRPGDRIGVVAPGGPVRRAVVERGLAVLRRRGFEVVPGRHLYERRAYLAGDDRMRSADLNRMLADPGIRAVWFARGGYGSHRIVDGIDFAPLARSPKALIGYSDVTVLQAAAWSRLGLSTYQGPLVTELGDRRAYDPSALWRALGGGPLEFPLRPASIVRPGRGVGPIVGGCLSIVAALVGTPYMPRTRGAILYWEEVNEEPFRIDRMLAHLRLAGVLKGLRGMIVGRLVGCRAGRRGQGLPLRDILESHIRGADYPVVIDFPAGHAPGKKTLPLGRASLIDTAGLRVTVSAALNRRPRAGAGRISAP